MIINYRMNVDNYGFVFNDIIIHDNIVKKTYKNPYGKWKINNEIRFYRFVEECQIPFKVPKLLDWQDGVLTIEFVKDSSTLTNMITAYNSHFYMNEIINHLKPLHAIIIPVSSEVVKRDLQIEIEKKVLNRFSEFDWNTSCILSIRCVNGRKIRNINVYCDLIKSKFSNINITHYNLIHGDVHLGNILCNCNTNDLVFIDPRGYFGETELFGMREYDFAKLLFGLSGYSYFDTMEINTLKLENNNLDIDFIRGHEYIFENSEFDEVTKLLCLSIWLSNNSCFSNINKKITSLMTAYYYCEKILFP